jgi:hypothetical protein
MSKFRKLLNLSKILDLIFKKFMVYFYFTGKPKVLNPITYFRHRRDKYSKKQLMAINNGELYKYILDTINISNSTGCEFSDYLTIWDKLNKNDYKVILECGSGISTVVFAYYAYKYTKPIKFISMESEIKWHNQIKSIFPEKLKKYVQFVYSPREETLYNGIWGSHYAEVPYEKYDFIFIDGPGLRKVFKDKSYIKCFNADIINILYNEYTHTIDGILDQRIDTLRKLKKILKGDIKYNPIKKVAFFQNIRSDQLITNLTVKKPANSLSDNN